MNVIRPSPSFTMTRLGFQHEGNGNGFRHEIPSGDRPGGVSHHHLKCTLAGCKFCFPISRTSHGPSSHLVGKVQLTV